MVGPHTGSRHGARARPRCLGATAKRNGAPTAREVACRLVDDLTGESIPDGAGESLQLTHGGSAYEIDLSSANAAEFHDLLGRYASVGRKVPSRQRAMLTKGRIKQGT
ncbi:histone-like nucleoid-structuring protein Lsr2 [Arthrobacter sp. SW1]|uniref:Lsr2 dimerization domain-containing protein n=1 Tax=Arthrobacter sp. SW1 TaxID=1920889 RepID=UPI0009440868